MIGIFLCIGTLFVMGMGFYLKKETLNTLALEDARKTGTLVFEDLYANMRKGWSGKELEATLSRLNAVRPGMKVDIYRSEKVERLFGVAEGDRKEVPDDPLIRKAMQGIETMKIDDSYNIRYLYPLRVERRCLECHVNVRPGEINGVLDITLPAHGIVASLDRMVVYLLAILGILLISLFVYVYITVNRKIVRPLTALHGEVIRGKESLHSNDPIHVDSNCEEVKALEASFNDLTRQIHFYYERLLDSFTHDPLTGLYNINTFKKDLETMPFSSVLLINIDRFRELNDYYGFDVGDKILVEMAKKVREVLPEETKLYKLGGSEFCIVGAGAFDPNEIVEIMERLQALKFEDPALEGLNVTVTGGVVQHRRDHLIEKASIALSAAKQKNIPFEFYSNAQDVEKRYEHRIQWMNEVERAIEEGRLILHYQPIAKISDPAMKKYEALVRLVGRDGTIHYPGEFLDVVQNSRLYARLTQVVMEKCFETFENNTYSFSLNLSINDIKDAMCRNSIFEALKSYPEPGRVTFEILESEEVSDFEVINAFIEEVRRLGAKVAIDDFGSGYSNFHYLLKMRVDYYKIDASLIRYITEDRNSRMIVESLVHLAKRLGVETIAEYVENVSVAETCREIGIDYLQGYFIGKPGPLEF
ncbi:EAL domain-containing protein [Hydrogenimonas sp.]